jgi:hypothetical protein
MILGPVVVFRIAHRPSRTWNLLRPALFVAVRIATFILRAVMSKNSYGMGELSEYGAHVQLLMNPN